MRHEKEALKILRRNILRAIALHMRQIRRGTRASRTEAYGLACAVLDVAFRYGLVSLSDWTLWKDRARTLKNRKQQNAGAHHNNAKVGKKAG
jgi:hypothetical protein